MNDGPCPFDSRLWRTPYLVIPKMAIQAMPMEWRHRLDALMAEADRAGMVTPEYHVFRDDGPGKPYTRATVVNEQTGFVKICGGKPDPWADYRHATAEKVRALCPTFDPAPKLCPFNDEGAPELPDDFGKDEPCPVCGDLGTWDDENLQRPNRCVSRDPVPTPPRTEGA